MCYAFFQCRLTNMLIQSIQNGHAKYQESSDFIAFSFTTQRNYRQSNCQKVLF